MLLAPVALIASALASGALTADDSRPLREVAQGAAANARQAGEAGPVVGVGNKSDIADSKADGDVARKSKLPARAERLPGVTPEREAAVTKFVERHHPELAALLVSLKASHPEEYSRAIHDLFRTSERLAQWHERDAKRYEVELRLWQSQSQIDLLTAQLRMNKSETLQNQLRGAVEEQLTLRQALVKLERERVVERLKRLDDQLRTLEESRAEVIERTVRTAVDPPSRPNASKPGVGKIGGAKTGTVKANAAGSKSGEEPSKSTGKTTDRTTNKTTKSGE